MSKKLLIILLTILFINLASAQSIDQSFKTPPNSAKPHTWWHWLSGNVSKAGITKDLEAMKAVGIGGFQLFDVGLNVPNGNVTFNSPKFHEMVGFAAQESKRLDLEMGFNNCSGWSSSGGPWITVENSMKTVIWSETNINGGSTGMMQLAKPLAVAEQMKKNSDIDFYQEIAVLAFITPQENKYRLNDWKNKSLLDQEARPDTFGPDLRITPNNAIVFSNKILNLTNKMNANGELNWTAPAGNWTVVRFGYTSTGSMNKPGSKGGIGYEVDKLSKKASEVHWNALVSKLIEDTENATKVSSILIDSYEVGMNNWTEGFEQDFKKRRKYDLIPYLIAMTGRVVNNTETTERVLWDLRITVAEMMHDNYFDFFAKKCHEKGIKLAIEPYGNGTFDAAATTLLADIPMTEFWQNQQRNLWQWTSQIVTSGAHLSGKSIVGAESFTSMTGDWKDHPYKLKQFGDLAFAQGVNRYYFHTFTHQPWHDGVQPGMTFQRFGGNFHRNNTWYPKSGSWMDYIARCQYIFQAGTYQADVLVLYGDERGFNSFLQAKERLDVKEIPGLNLDLGGIGSLDNLSVASNGDLLVTYAGKLLTVRYKMLLLKRANLMLPKHIAILGALAEKGATIFAPRPLRSPSLENCAQADDDLKKLIHKYWDKGLIKEPKNYDAAVAKITPDLEAPEDIIFNRTQIEKDQYYFLSNQKDKAQEIKTVFRVKDQLPELWDPMTGEITEATNWKQTSDGRTEVVLEMSPLGSVFVVFRKPTTSKGITTAKAKQVNVVALNENWTVNFDPKWGPKSPIYFDKLTPWNEHSNTEIKYYSGTATYTKKFDLKDTSKTLFLDLGAVSVMAKVTLNGKELGTLWKRPFQIDISTAAKKGNNVLEIEVTNLWVNRMIGDEQASEKFEQTKTIPDWVKDAKIQTPSKTFVLFKFAKKEEPLETSGMMGPVQIFYKSNL